MNEIKIPNNSIKRISLLASIPSLSSEVYDTVRDHVMTVCNEICSKSQLLTLGRKTNTITLKDVEGAVNSIYYLKDMKIKSSKSGKQRNVSSCPNVLTQTYSTRDRSKVLEKRVLKSQKSYNCFYIPKSVIRKMSDKHTQPNIRKSKDALIMIQEVIETHILNIFNYAYDIEVNKTMSSNSIKKSIEKVKMTFTKVEDNQHTELGTYIKKVAKQIDPSLQISNECVFQINTVLNLLGNKLAIESFKFSNSKGKTTVNKNEIVTVVELFISGELIRFAKNEMDKAVARAGRSTVPSEAGLLFPPSRVSKYFKPYNTRVSIDTKIALAAVLEYLSAEIIEQISNCTRDDRKKTMSVRHMSIAIRNDKELSTLICNTLGYDVPLSGVMVNFKNKW